MKMKIRVLQGDITDSETEAIVNAANNHFWMGSGVAGAIKAKGGVEIEQEAVAKGPIGIGEAIETGAGKLPFKYVIHAAGMGQDLKTDRDIVNRVTQNSLKLADSLELKSIALPAIGTGVGGMPLRECAEVMISALKDMQQSVQCLLQVDFILFDKSGFELLPKIE